MTDHRPEVRAWLEFAAEIGIDGLEVRRPPATPSSPVAVADTASVTPPTPSATPATAVRRMREMFSDDRAPPELGARASSSATPLISAQRIEAIPAEKLVSPPAADGTLPAAPATSLADVVAEIGDCRRCRLHEGRTKIVFGSGNPNAELMFVGEGPGRDEDLQGLPFVGRAGQLLTDIIKAIDRTRDDVYIANVVKCRPPENRTPESDEMAACGGFLWKQLALVRPRVVVALGRPAAETLLGVPVVMGKIRGQRFPFHGATLVPTYHPAYLLRTPSAKREVWEDMKLVRELLA